MASPLAPLLLVALTTGLVHAQDERKILDRLAELSLEELLEVEVTSVARTAQRLPHSAAAVFVITQEDIRRSGHHSVPELLRMVPGLHVARINANSWAIAARGFNGRFNNKMLVMIDGRTVFDGLFSGVYWDVQDLRLADIERIEVVRGPGGSVWGANAVNGVINIVTKHAAETQGTELTLRAGLEENGLVSGRYGALFGETGHWRTYAKAFDRDASRVRGSSADHPDEWDQRRSGFRMDWTAGERDAFTLQGDLYEGRTHETSLVTRRTPPPDLVVTDETAVGGGNLLGRWTRNKGPDAEEELQLYLDVTSRRSDLFDDLRGTFDLDYQSRHRLEGRHELLWGLGYRWIRSRFEGSTNFDLAHGRRSDHLFSAFVQDAITLAEDELVLTLGTKLEHNDFTGFEIQPSLRLLWTPSPAHTLWSAVSRAVRTPSVVQHELRHTVAETTGPSTTTLTTLTGNDDLGADELVAYEAGWRTRLAAGAHLDVAAFYNDFGAVDNFTLGTPIDLGGGLFQVPAFFDNAREAEVAGVEVELDVDVTRRWKLRCALSWLDLVFSGDPLGTPIQPRTDDEEPNWFGSLRSYWNVTDALDLDLALYAVDDLDDLGVPGYLRLDGRLAYHPSERLELSLGIQNATDGQHPEFASAPLSSASELERTAYLQLLWRP